MSGNKNMREMSTDEMDKVSSGMKIVVLKSPKFISRLFKYIFTVKKDPVPDNQPGQE